MRLISNFIKLVELIPVIERNESSRRKINHPEETESTIREPSVKHSKVAIRNSELRGEICAQSLPRF